MEIKKDPIKKRNSEPEFNYSAWVEALLLCVRENELTKEIDAKFKAEFNLQKRK